MGLRTLTFQDLKNIISNEDYQRFVNSKCSSSYRGLSNNYPSLFVKLLENYQIGFECFIKSIDEEYKKVETLLLSKTIIADYYTTLSDNEIALKLFNYGNCSLQYHLIASLKSLERISRQLKNEEELFDTEYYEGLIYLFGNIAFDATSLFYKNSRRTQKTVEHDIFILSKNLLRNYSRPNDPTIPSTIFLLRQCIELKILESIGLVSVKNNSNRELTVKISDVLKYLLEQEKKGLIKSPIPIKSLLLINDWTNKYIHTGNFRQYYWEVEWCHHILNDFIFDGIIMQSSYLENTLKSDFKLFMYNSKPVNITWNKPKCGVFSN